MLIGELANRTECPRDTIRFYEKVGLIEGKRGRSGTNNYKHYDDQMVDRILLVKQAKIFGFTLAEIKGLIGAWQANTLSLKEKISIFQDKIVLVDRRISELRQVKQYLQRKVKRLTES